MKVLQLITRRQYRGAEVFTATLSSALIAEGVEILFAALYDPPPVDVLSVPGAKNIDLGGNKKFLSLSLLKKITALIESENPDIIQANGSDTLKYAVLARIFSKKKPPVLYRNISMIGVWLGRSLLKKMFYRWLFANVDYVTSVGSDSLDNLIKSTGFPADRAAVVRRGIPVNPNDKKVSRLRLNEMLQLEPGVRVVVHAGHFGPEKNHRFLIDVFDKLRGHANIKLLMVGDGPLLPEIRSLIGERGLAGNIFVLGLRKDLDFFLSAADVFVLCSTVEGVPGVILEAAAQKTPALAVAVGGVKEVVVHDVTGWIMSDHNLDAFCNTLLSIIFDDVRIRRMAENAYEYVVKNYNTHATAASFMQLYSDLLKPSK